MPPGKIDDKRKSRNIALAALLALFLIYFVKLTFPTQHGHSSISRTFINRDGAAQGGNGATARKPSGSHSAGQAVPHHDEPFNGTIVDKVAVIVEDRPRPNLIPLILHFSSVLGPTWPIIIYTSSENVGIFSSSQALGRHLRSGIIQIRILPQTILFTNSDSVSSFLTKPFLWENLAPAKWILMFQSDSMLCSNAARSVEDFFAYDFVGAPIAEHLGAGMNGGLSLRKRETILKILEEHNWDIDQGRRFEDLWYFDKLTELAAQEEEAGITDGVKLPSLEVARTFSVETIDFPHPLGVHQVGRWINGQAATLDNWCPEYKMCSSEFISDTGH